MLVTATAGLGRPIEFRDSDTTRYLQASGFTDITQHTVHLPLDFEDHWPEILLQREIAKWYTSFLGTDPQENDCGIEAISLAPFTRYYGWTVEQWNAFRLEVFRSIKYSNVRVCHTL